MVTFAQTELRAEPGILKSIARQGEILLGIYAEIRTFGRIRLGDAVVALSA